MKRLGGLFRRGVYVEKLDISKYIDAGIVKNIFDGLLPCFGGLFYGQ